MAIGSPDKSARLAQLRSYARLQVRSGFETAEQVRADVFDAVHDEVKELDQAQQLTDELLNAEIADLTREAASWSGNTQFDDLQAAFADLEARDIVVLQACEDHWAAQQVLEKRAAEGKRPWGIAYFTPSDVWHAVEHGMLEINLWHGSSANVAAGEELLTFVHDTLARHGIASLFDEGRIEVTVSWQRRPTSPSS
ncbi:MAG: hypothetical protein H0T14_04395 [Nocardioidaceae bacterium]|nr:hypothetical protein [Nocardioidaceae bacterium]